LHIVGVQYKPFLNNFIKDETCRPRLHHISKKSLSIYLMDPPWHNLRDVGGVSLKSIHRKGMVIEISDGVKK